jgi:hypothetical protein
MCPMNDIPDCYLHFYYGGGMLLHASTNKRIAVVTMLLIFFSVCGWSQLQAQPRRISPEDRTARLKERLKLTDDQADSVLTIFKNGDEEMRKEFESHRGDREAMRDAMTAHRKDTNDRIRALLNGDQQKEFDQMLKEAPPRQPGMRGRRDG